MLNVNNLNDVAFLFIDLQPIFTDGTDPIFETKIVDTLKYARSILPPERIIHIRANYANTPMMTVSSMKYPTRKQPTDPRAAPWAEETSDETVIVKTTIDGFHNTNLEEYLKNHNVKVIFLCGLLTCCCVHETAIGGLIRGFIPIMIEDACIDKNEEKHKKTIDLFNDYLYQFVSLDDVKKFFTVPIV